MTRGTPIRVAAVVMLAVVVNAAVAVAQSGVTLGPKDGAGLPPTDPNRVAVGAPAPDFSLESKDGAVVTLSSLRGKKDVVLVFYRGHW